MAVGVGSTVWLFDFNHRVYLKREPGESPYISHAPIWRGHWVPWEITGETSRSWVLSHGKKVPKVGASPAVVAFSEEEITQQAWVHENRHRIERVVGSTHDYEKLRAVAALVGYTPPQTA